MSTKIINKGAFLRAQRLFPSESQPLSVEIDRAYVDIAAKTNDKTIGFFATSGSSITGEKWALGGETYVGFRQMYQITGTGNIPHLLTLSNIVSFTKIYGVFTDGTSWYPLPYVDSTAANNQVQVVVNGTNIVITAGAGAPPTVSSGFVVLEWIVRS